MANTPSPLLALPPELRDQILVHLLVHDIETFAETTQLPPLLRVNQQLRQEYGSVFYTTTLIKLEAYYNASDSWASITGRSAKQVILERSSYQDLFDFWSLASARRFCQKGYVGSAGEDVQRGIVIVSTNAGFRRWMWTTRT